jgi:hypothetical protein
MERIGCLACLVLVASCSFDTSGISFRDAADPRDDGAANGSDAGGGDGRPGAFDASRPDSGTDCDAVCPGSCRDNVCEIDCSGPVDCSDDVTCPAGFDCVVLCGDDDCSGDILCGDGVGSCTVDCGGNDSCTGSITCTAASCTVDCIGFDSCQGDISCGPGSCEVTCLSESCTGGIDCSASCGCDVFCLGRNNCTTGSDCPGQCGNGNDGCTAIPPGCNSCSASAR